MKGINKIPAKIPHFHFWVVVILFIIGIILHYPQQILSWNSVSLFSFLGLSRHAVERIFFLLPIGYGSFFLGSKAGLIGLAVAAAIMLPRVFLISDYFSDAMFETIVIIFVGGMMNLWFHSYRSEKEKQRRILSTIEKTHEELQSQAIAADRSERQFVTINRISSTVSQSLELSQALDNAVSSIIGLLRVDAAWIYLLDRDNTELHLAAHRGNYEEFTGVEAESSINKKVISTGQPMLVEDVSKETRIVVPLNVKGKTIGTLGVQSRSRRYFDNEEIELLAVIGNQIAVAIENTRLYDVQRQTMDELSKSEGKYRRLIERASDAIWANDLSGRVTVANPAAVELMGDTVETMIGSDIRKFLNSEGLETARRVRRILLAGQPLQQPYEQKLIRKNKSEITLMVSTSLVKHADEPPVFEHIARDVTKEKEMQEQLRNAYHELSESHQQLKDSQQQLIQAEKLTSLGQLAASIAHEVNNPLTGVLVYTQLIAKKLRGDGIDKNVAIDYLGKMEFELNRSTKLVKNLLDFARQSSPKFQQTNLNAVINRAYDLASHSAALQHVGVIKELDPALPDITADADQLQQVFTNLILNAIQAMPQGGKLYLRTSANDKKIKIEVEDTGTGISPENMNKLFTPFFTTKREVKGVGLGLAISYGIVQRHKGKIEVQSKLGQGTTFTILLPIHLDTDEK